MCACAISLGAQSSTSSATPQTAAGGHDVTVTGCVAKAADGGFMLTNAMVEPMTATTAGTSTGTTGATTSGTATGATAGGTTAAGATAGTAAATTGGTPMSGAATSWTLMGGTDLDKHVGHKVSISGRTTWDPSMNRNMTANTAGTGATAGTAGSTAGTAGATAGGATTGGSATTTAKGPSVTVTNLKMVSSSCP
jgi:hypothetical protein